MSNRRRMTSHATTARTPKIEVATPHATQPRPRLLASFATHPVSTVVIAMRIGVVVA